MKEKINWGFLWNPYLRIAGCQAFLLGLIIVVVTGIVGAYGGIAFDGVLDTHFTESIDIGKSLLFLCIDVISVVLIMWLAGLTISRNFRFVDILGTMTLSRAPLLLLAIIALFITFPSEGEVLANPMIVFSSPSIVLYLLLSILMVVWYIALMYHGFRVSTGASGNKVWITFSIALILAEVLSKLLIYYLLY